MLPSPHRRTFTACLLFTSMVFFSSQSAFAEDLLQVYNVARERDARMLSARALLSSAEPRAAQASGLLWPSISATGSRMQSDSDSLDPAGGRVGTTTSNLNLTVRQPLFNRAASIDVAKAKSALEIARAEFDTTEQEFIVQVAQTYFDVLSAQDVLVATRSSKVSLAGQLASTKRNFEAGTAIITDVRDTQARYDLAVAQEMSADNELHVRQLLLSRLVGRRNVTINSLAMPMALTPVVPADVDAWIDSAERHPSVRRALLALQIAKLDSARAEAARLPTVNAVGTVERNVVAGGGITALPGASTNTSLGVEVNLPLFAGYTTQNRIAETLLLEERARQELEATQKSVVDGVQRAFFDLQSAEGQVRALAVAEVSSKLSLEGTQLGYRAGVRLNLDVLNAQALLFQTQRDLAKARYDVLMGGLKLRLSSGQLTPDDVTAVNRLLAQ